MTTGDHNDTIKAVGIKQLKVRLSEYVRLVKSGETILVTERGKVVAEMRPSRGSLPSGATLEERLDALAAAGEITRARIRKKPGWTWKVKGLGLPAGTALALLDEMRADRV